MTSKTLKPILKAEDLFDSLDKEQREPEDLRIKIEKSERLEEIVRGFEEGFKIVDNSEAYIFHKIYKDIQIIPTSKEILEFSVLLNDYQDYNDFEINSGLYLSALVKKSDEQEFTINTQHLGKKTCLIGYENNGKIIHINGDAGTGIGCSMTKGIIYAGNVNSFFGDSMLGGEIYAKKLFTFPA
jgi:hypothetical protein